MEIHTRQKSCHFARYVAKAKLFCQKSYVPVIRVGVFIWVNFHPGYRDLGRKNRDLGNRAKPASHMNTSKCFTKEGVARRDHGNRASPIDRAHMKRPLDPVLSLYACLTNVRKEWDRKMSTRRISHFRVSMCLSFKTSPCAKPFIRKMSFIYSKMNV